MILSKNRARIRKRAAEDVRKKLMLEPHLDRDMRKIFKSLLDDYLRLYAKKGSAVIPAHYEDDITSALRTHYRRVANAFIMSSRHEKDGILYKAKNDKYAEANDSIWLKLNPHIVNHSKRQSKLITKTTTSQLEKAINKQVMTSLQSGNPLSYKKIADVVKKDYLQKIPNRTYTIGVTETQSMSEYTKDTELEQMIEDQEGTKSKFSRVWVAVLDERTREWHADADGQTVDVDEPFIVMDEELQFPGDPDGSDENIMNCRCVAVPLEESD